MTELLLGEGGWVVAWFSSYLGVLLNGVFFLLDLVSCWDGDFGSHGLVFVDLIILVSNMHFLPYCWPVINRDALLNFQAVSDTRIKKIHICRRS